MPVETKIFNEPYFIKDLSHYGQIVNVHFSSYEWSQDLLLIATKTNILLAHLDLNKDIDVKILKVFNHPCQSSALGISPECTLTAVPNNFLFCSAGIDEKLRFFKTDFMQTNECNVIAAHKSFINDVAFDPVNKYMISTGDDNVVKIWKVENFHLKRNLVLSSAGMNVCWNKADPEKFLVAEKLGLIKIFSAETEICLFSVDYGRTLSACHWAPSDPEMVTSLHSGEILIWELPNRCLPISSSILFSENGGNVKFSPQSELIAATNNLEGSLKVLHVKSQLVKFTANLTLPTNVTWHYRYPLICVGDDYNLCFWETGKE